MEKQRGVGTIEVANATRQNEMGKITLCPLQNTASLLFIFYYEILIFDRV